MTRDTVEILTTVDSLAPLASEWSALGAGGWGPLVSFDWFSAAARNFCGPKTLRVVTVRRAGRLVALAPLCWRRNRGVRWLELVGARALYEPTDLPAADEGALASLCAALVKQRWPTIIQRLCLDDSALDILRAEAASIGGYVHVAQRVATHYLPAGRADLTSARRRWKFRRLWRALEASGVRSQLLSPTPEQVPRILDEFMRVEAAGWKGRAGSSLASRPELRAFFAELSVALASRGELRVWTLANEVSWVAAQLCAEVGGRVWVLKIGFDETWARYAPGIVLTAEAVVDARQRGLGFEFLGAAEDWQMAWRPEVRRHCAAILYPRSAPGVAARVVDRGIDLIRSLARGRRTARARGPQPGRSDGDDAT